MGIRSARLVRAAIVLAVAAALAAGGASSAGPGDTTVKGAEGTLESIQRAGGAVMLELAGDPSAVAWAKARKLGASEASAGQTSTARKEANEAAQADVVQQLERAGIDATVLYQVQTAYNGIAVQAAPGEISDLASLPGVKAVHVIPLVELDNHSSVPLIGSQRAWSNYGMRGEGMSIAVIDTGVDYVHRGFGGSGSSADYLVARSAAANPPADPNVDNSGFKVMSGGRQIYPTAKVTRGVDLAGDLYSASSPGPNIPFDPVPKPDPNPMDCNGHGTHVAGTAAGTGVNADTTTYTGPYTSSVNLSTLGIGPGVAPLAEIYAIRIFGCEGNTALTTAAIEWATDPNRDGNPSDHVDVINMSLGSSYGTPDDPSAAASNNAVDAGVIVVTSAGNSGDSYFVSGSPGSAQKAIATASSLDAAERADAIIVNAPASIAGKYIGSKSQAFDWNKTPETTGNVYYPATNQYGCSRWTDATDLANIKGRIVLVDWKKATDATFPCGSGARANNAAADGAIGIIMADSTTFLDTAIAGNAAIPAMYTNVNVGNTLKSVLTPGSVNPALNVTLSGIQVGESVDDARIDAISGFTSRGPRARDTGLKPDITAPGQTIWSPDRLTGFRGRSLNGTSMAAPHMAGVMALLKQSRPTWTVEQLKALAMNTAHSDLYAQFNKSGDKYGPGRVGAGRVQVDTALSSNAVAYADTSEGAVSVSFGAVEVDKRYRDDREIRIENHGSTDLGFSVAYDARTTIPGVQVTVPTSVNVPAGSSATIDVNIDADAAQMQNTRDATVAATQGGNPRQWLSEASGLVILTPTAGPALRVPVYAAMRPASRMQAVPKAVKIGRTNTGSVTLLGRDVNTGTEPLGYVSKVSAFEHGLTSGKATLGTGVSELARGADIEHVGATRKGTSLYFGISTHADWAVPATETQFNVLIDWDNDGKANATAFTSRTGTSTTPLDVLVVGVNTSAVAFTNIFNSNVNTAPYNNSVVNVPVPLSALGLPTTVTTIKYRVQGLSRFWGQIDETPWVTYDLAAPGLQFSDGIAGTNMYEDLNFRTIGVTYNDASFKANGSGGILLLHHFNTRGNRTEVLKVLK